MKLLVATVIFNLFSVGVLSNRSANIKVGSTWEDKKVRGPLFKAQSPGTTLTCLLPDSIAPDPKDVGSVDGIIAALYDVISGPAGQKRNWDRMRTLFLPESRLIPTGRNKAGKGVMRVLSVEDYIKSSGPLLERDGFFERELGRTTEQFGSIVQCFSTYDSKRKADDEKPFMRGINSIQLWNDGTRWWIISVMWQSETPELSIPEKYIRKS